MNEQLKSTQSNIANDLAKNEELSNMRILDTKESVIGRYVDLCELLQIFDEELIKRATETLKGTIIGKTNFDHFFNNKNPIE